jgi:hypothetical protein
MGGNFLITCGKFENLLSLDFKTLSKFLKLTKVKKRVQVNVFDSDLAQTIDV